MSKKKDKKDKEDENQDSELSDLLAELDSCETHTIIEAPKPVPGEEASHDSEYPPRQELILKEPVRVKGGAPVPADDQPPIDYALFIGRFIEDYDLTADRITTDRQRMVTIMDMFYGRAVNGQATDIETESLVKLMGSLSDSNGHKVKLMDSMAKLLAAAKPGLVINQNFEGQDDPDELTRILSEPIDDNQPRSKSD